MLQYLFTQFSGRTCFSAFSHNFPDAHASVPFHSIFRTHMLQYLFTQFSGRIHMLQFLFTQFSGRTCFSTFSLNFPDAHASVPFHSIFPTHRLQYLFTQFSRRTCFSAFSLNFPDAHASVPFHSIFRTHTYASVPFHSIFRTHMLTQVMSGSPGYLQPTVIKEVWVFSECNENVCCQFYNMARRLLCFLKLKLSTTV